MTFEGVEDSTLLEATKMSVRAWRLQKIRCIVRSEQGWICYFCGKGSAFIDPSRCFSRI